jgi:NAD(P)-dependent dehydrogenase (short-subunit alcohol dehydrogenase family)
MAAEMIAKKGFNVFAAHLLPESASKLSAKGNITPVQVDITKQESVDAAAKIVEDKIGSNGSAELFGLVNNAGLLYRAGPVEWTPAENFDKMMQVNVIGAARVTKALLPLLRKSHGRIVNVASMGGQISVPSQVAYSASKFAMEGFSDGLRREMFDWGVSVHIIEPGVFAQTGLYKTYHDGVQQLWQGLNENVQTAWDRIP